MPINEKNVSDFDLLHQESKSYEIIEIYRERHNNNIIKSSQRQLERGKSLAQVFQSKKANFIMKKKKKDEQQAPKKLKKPTQKTKQQLNKLRKQMRKYKNNGKVETSNQSKSIDIMYGLFSRGTSQSNTIVTEGFTDFKNNINKLESPELTIKSPKLGEGQGQEILQRFNFKVKKEPSLQVQIRLAQGLKPKINMKEARNKAKINSKQFSQNKIKKQEQQKRNQRKELSQKQKQYDKKLRDNLRKKTKQLQQLQSKMLEKYKD